jgi:hypothetical protein
MNTKRKVLLGIYALVFVMSITGIMRSTSSQAEFTIKAAIQASTQDEVCLSALVTCSKAY